MRLCCSKSPRPMKQAPGIAGHRKGLVRLRASLEPRSSLCIMIAVRLATMDDIEAIARETSSVQELHNEALPLIFKPPSADLFPAQKLATLIEDPNSIVAVAEMDGKVVGHIYGAIISRAE